MPPSLPSKRRLKVFQNRIARFIRLNHITFTIEILGVEVEALLTLTQRSLDAITDESFLALNRACANNQVNKVRELGRKLFICGFVKSDGEFEPCPYGGHIRQAVAHGYHDDDGAQQAGWIKVSMGHLSAVVRPTPAQVAWVQGPYADSGHTVPDWVVRHQSVPDSDGEYARRLRECLRQT